MFWWGPRASKIEVEIWLLGIDFFTWNPINDPSFASSLDLDLWTIRV